MTGADLCHRLAIQYRVVTVARAIVKDLGLMVHVTREVFVLCAPPLSSFGFSVGATGKARRFRGKAISFAKWKLLSG